tara:strand:- start:1546 stop:1755 length:210 start_codon:yes stop_codon:yes gene_type:complete
MRLVVKVDKDTLNEFSLVKGSFDNLRHQLEQYLEHDNNFVVIPKEMDIQIYDLENPEKEIEIRVMGEDE